MEISRFFTTSEKIVPTIVFSLAEISALIGAVLIAGFASIRLCCDEAAAKVYTFKILPKLSALSCNILTFAAFTFILDCTNLSIAILTRLFEKT